jgi:predicted DNA-binding protein YlxM (UPF0122 family)
VQITEKKKRLIDLYFYQHRTYAEITEREKMSPRDIYAIIKEEEARRQKNINFSNSDNNLMLQVVKLA